MDNARLPKLQKGGRSPKGSRQTITALFESPAAGKAAQIKAKAELAALKEEQEDEATKAARMQHRAVVVRSVYSKARMSLVAMKREGNSGSLLQPVSENGTSKVRFMAAAKAIQHATRQTIIGRSMVEAFMAVASEAKEKARLKAEIDKLAREAEEHARRKESEEDGEEPMSKTCAFLTNLLEELEANKKSGATQNKDNAVKFEVLVQDMSEVMAKINALQGLYAMNLQNTNAITGSMDTLATDIQRILSAIGKSANELNADIQGMGAQVAEELSVAKTKTAKSGPELPRQLSRTSQLSTPPEQYTSADTELSRSSSSHFTPLFRKAAIVASFESMLVGALKDVEDAVTDVNKSARGTLELSMTQGLGPDEDLSSTPRGSYSRGQSFASTTSPTPSSPSRRKTQPFSPNEALSEEVEPHGDEDNEDLHAFCDSKIGQPRISRCSAESLLCAMVCDPEDFPALGEKVVVPHSLSQLLVYESSSLAVRFQTPFAILPCVVAPRESKGIFRRRPPRNVRKAFAKKDANLSTVEMVLAERIQRGVRDTADDWE